MRSYLLMALAIAVALPALAHDSWIARGNLRNPQGEWCCGDNDCAVMDEGTVSEMRGGLSFRGGATVNGHGNQRLFVNEVVPFSEVMASKDGLYWRCHRSDGSRRCTFGPPPGM